MVLKFKTMGWIFLLPTLVLLVLLSMQVADFIELGQQKKLAQDRFLRTRMSYFMSRTNLNSTSLSPPLAYKKASYMKVEMKAEMQHLEFKYKALKYEKKAKFSLIKLCGMGLLIMGVILYRARGV